jgi:hypothetical protein
MKKTAAALAAVLLAASLAACAKSPAPSGSAQIQSSSQSVSQSVSSSGAAAGAGSASQSAGSAASASASGSQTQAEQAQYTDKSYVGDVEEVSSYSFTLPEFSAPKSIADKLNTFYADVAQQMISYTQTDVYKKAQDLGAVGLLSGTYTVEQTDGSLKVTLSVSVNYAGAADAETHTRVDTFDPATGECTGTEKN